MPRPLNPSEPSPPIDAAVHEYVNDQMSQRQFFVDMENRLADLEPKDALKIYRDRWVLFVMVTGMAMTMSIYFGAKGTWMTWIVLSGLVFEVSALGVFTYRQLLDVVPDFVDAKRKYAIELDRHFFEYERIRKQLQSLAPPERMRRLAYVELRLESFQQRYPLLFGAADKLGVLPALVGLFLQLRAIDSLSLATGVVGALVLMLYVMGLWMARFRLQLQGYARLLRAADRD